MCYYMFFVLSHCQVIVHFLRKGETRVTRVQRIMIWLGEL